MTQQTYDRLLHLGITLAAQGYPVILDAKYDRQPLRQAVIQAIATANADPATPTLSVQILHCDAPLDVRQAWLHARQNDVSDATADLLPNQSMDPFTALELPLVKTFDPTQDLEAQLNQLGD